MGYRIALISPAGGGKDFIADYFISKYGFERYAFADNVKAVAKQWFPDIYKDESKKPRALLQHIGTSFREVDTDVWIKAMFKNIDDEANERRRLSYASENIVVTDCRMPNEYRALKDKGFTFIRIDVSPEVRLERLSMRGDVFSMEDLNHHTESFYDEFECEFIVSNNGSKEDTYSKVDFVFNLIRTGNFQYAN